MTYKKLPSLSHLIPQLVQAMERELSHRGEDNAVTNTIGYLSWPIGVMNSYLKEHNLPLVRNCILFSRPGTVAQEIHIDCTSADHMEIVNCALNFPIENCNNLMYWYDGSYDIATKESVGKDNFKRKYAVLNWHNEPKIINQTVIDVPTLVKVSVPHNVEHVPEHRKLLTFRFHGNPSYEEIAQAFSH